MLLFYAPFLMSLKICSLTSAGVMQGLLSVEFIFTGFSSVILDAHYIRDVMDINFPSPG